MLLLPRWHRLQIAACLCRGAQLIDVVCCRGGGKGKPVQTAAPSLASVVRHGGSAVRAAAASARPAAATASAHRSSPQMDPSAGICRPPRTLVTLVDTVVSLSAIMLMWCIMFDSDLAMSICQPGLTLGAVYTTKNVTRHFCKAELCIPQNASIIMSTCLA